MRLVAGWVMAAAGELLPAGKHAAAEELTDGHDAHARAKASATRSCAVSRSPTLTSTANRHSSLASR